jgi:hypothetical protein
MTLVDLNKHELDFIIGILKHYKIRITQDKKLQPLQKELEDRHYPDMIQHMIDKLEKYWVKESGKGKK